MLEGDPKSRSAQKEDCADEQIRHPSDGSWVARDAFEQPKEFLSMTDTHHGTATQLVPVTLPGMGHAYLDQSMFPKVNAFIANAQLTV
jgi:hypothetical protein